VKAIILAAGTGSRLKKLTKFIPKCLVEINGKSLLQSQIDNFKSKKINKIIIIGGHKSRKLKKFNKKIIINKDYKKTNMLWSLFKAEKEMNEDLIVSYGDIAYSKFTLNKLLKSKAEISIIYDKNWNKYWKKRFANPIKDVESFRLNKNREVIEIGNKVNSLKNIQGQYIGLIKFRKKALKNIKKIFKLILKNRSTINNKPIRKAYMTDFLQELIRRKFKVIGVPIFDGWFEIDTVNDFHLNLHKKRFIKIIK
tara:strand:+ start:21442 stop:22200 length:759 start_codon:yes stop_codon:yes gene_type:complete